MGRSRTRSTDTTSRNRFCNGNARHGRVLDRRVQSDRRQTRRVKAARRPCRNPARPDMSAGGMRRYSDDDAPDKVDLRVHNGYTPGSKLPMKANVASTMK